MEKAGRSGGRCEDCEVDMKKGMRTRGGGWGVRAEGGHRGPVSL